MLTFPLNSKNLFYKTISGIFIRPSVFIDFCTLLSKATLKACNPFSQWMLGYKPATSAVTKIAPPGVFWKYFTLFTKSPESFI